jgi:hypothetical protein
MVYCHNQLASIDYFADIGGIVLGNRHIAEGAKQEGDGRKKPDRFDHLVRFQFMALFQKHPLYLKSAGLMLGTNPVSTRQS